MRYPLIISYICRRTCISGLVTDINTVLGLSEPLLTNDCFKFLLIYKFSQDHLELFFNLLCLVSVRLSILGLLPFHHILTGGWNNNPSASHFKAAFWVLNFWSLDVGQHPSMDLQTTALLRRIQNWSEPPQMSTFLPSRKVKVHSKKSRMISPVTSPVNYMYMQCSPRNLLRFIHGCCFLIHGND